MKKSINRNILAAEYFIKILLNFGVRDICISPGSRNTPLIVAISKNSNIQAHIIVDERTSCFFALGLARQTGNPVAVVTTSGTAAAELTPGIVEAYFSRLPLIICTADRPGYLIERGANQVINQRNMFFNHVKEFYDVGLPGISKRWFGRLSKNVAAKLNAQAINPGPVHFNFPFEKPFEPGSHTDEVDPEFLSNLDNEVKNIKPTGLQPADSRGLSKKVIARILGSKKILLSVGPLNNRTDITEPVSILAEKLDCPVAPDGLARIFFDKLPHVIDNFSTIALSSEFIKKNDPDLIIHFGNAPVSKSFLEFFKDSKAHKIAVNSYGDKIDPTRTVDEFIKISPGDFCSELLNSDIQKSDMRKNSWYQKVKRADAAIDKLKTEMIFKKRFPFEGRIIKEIYSLLPEESNLFLSNSMPVRDFEYFISDRKNINLYYNRGASGIDGIISTACGTGSKSDLSTALITGDLAFYHDLNSLYLCNRNAKPIVLVVINNDGGGIFEMLPIAEERIDFEKYFKTPVRFNYEHAVKAFGLKYCRVSSWADLKSQFNKAIKLKTSTVIEIKSSSKQSLSLRRKFWNEARETVNKIINER